MALSPDLIRRRRRTQLPRAPHKRLAEKIPTVKGANGELQTLLKDLLEEAKKETLFTMTLGRDRLFSALFYAGFQRPLWINTENTIGPLATVTTYVPVPAGMVLVPRQQTGYVSLPWWLSVSIWVDSDLPALPMFTITRSPGEYSFIFRGVFPMRRFVRLTATNLHAVNTIHSCIIQALALMTTASWEMIEEIYLKPIAVYAQEKAEELTGRPYP